MMHHSVNGRNGTVAKPDLDDGWIRYAHELDAALAVADFTKGARIVLREVFAQIYGPPKRRTAVVSSTAIGAALGVDRQNIQRAVKELVDANVLTKRPDGTYRFNKDYETWTHGGRRAEPHARRLTAAEVRYCRQAPARAMALMDGEKPKTDADPVVQPDYTTELRQPQNCSPNGLHSDSPCNPNGLQDVVQPDYKLSSNRTTENAAPIEERARNSRLQDSKTEEEEHEQHAGTRANESAPTEKPKTLRSARPAAPQSLVEQVDAWARRTVPNGRWDLEGVTQHLQSWLDSYEPSWVEDAIALAGVNAKFAMSSYVNKCLVRWKATGMPTHERQELDRLKAEQEAAAAARAASSVNGTGAHGGPAPRKTNRELRQEQEKAAEARMLERKRREREAERQQEIAG